MSKEKFMIAARGDEQGAMLYDVVRQACIELDSMAGYYWCDCGPFICFFAYFLSIGLPIPLSAITMKQAIRWRETMATYLMESEIPVHSSLWP
jgi:hypothetical protein